MTYSLNTLNASAGGKAPERSAGSRFGHEMGLVFGLTALVSGSMWPVWLGHVLIAVGSDEAAMAWWTRAGRPPR